MTPEYAISAALKSARTSEVRDRLHRLVVRRYAEPGYESERGVYLSNWNDLTRWENGTLVVLDDTMERLENILTKMDYVCDWEDEYAICDDCGSAFRSEPDNYFWQMYGSQDNGDNVCGTCLKAI